MGNAFIRALQLIISGNKEIFLISWTSLSISLISTVVSAALSISFALFLYLVRFKFRRVILIILNSLMAVPTVVIGLFVYSMVSRSGIFGSAGLLFTPAAIIIGQVLLSFPIITSLTFSALSGLDNSLEETLRTFSITGIRKLVIILNEAKLRVLLAVVTGFGRVIGEIGISMLLGGNIRWYTRTITTAIALETSKGEFEQGLALGIILLFISLTLNAMLQIGATRHE